MAFREPSRRRSLWRLVRPHTDADETTPVPRMEDMLYFPEASSRPISSYLPPIPSFRRSKSTANLTLSRISTHTCTTVRSIIPATKALRSTSSRQSLDISPLSDLPIEILVAIFSHIAPPSLSPHSDHTLLLLPPNRNAHFTALRQLLRLSLICRTWRDLIVPFLYANVWLTGPHSSKALARLLLEDDLIRSDPDDHVTLNKGRYIRHLRVTATPIFRNDPADIMTIVDYASNLESFSDSRGLRRIRAGFGLSPPHMDPATSPEAVAERLASPAHKEGPSSLRALDWTAYDDGPVEPDLAPILRGPVGHTLVHLSLGLAFASDAVDLQPLTFASGATSDAPNGIFLPALKSLCASIDSGVFHTLATWSMPALDTLAVIARDYSNAARALGRFLLAHGTQILHLELAHAQDELSLVAQRKVLRTRRNAAAGLCSIEEDLDLVLLVPSLRTLVCSADAEWRWQDPDWIAPHVLLLTHPTLERIAIRGLGARVGWDLPFGMSWNENDAQLYGLLQQLDTESLRLHFPRLQKLQDLSGALRAFDNHAPGIPLVVRRFWFRVLRNCAQNHVAFEDCTGSVVPVPDLSAGPI